MKRISSLTAFVALVAAALVGCKNDDPNEIRYDNKLYIASSQFTDEMLIKGSVKQYSREITVGMAQPVGHDVRVTFAAEPALLDRYHNAYYCPEAVLLGEEHYAFAQTESLIKAGGVTGSPVTIDFRDTDKLDRDRIYVLPVTIASVEGVELLASARSIFYVFKAGSLINVVANIAQNSFEVKWTTDVSKIPVITVEALIRVSDFGAVGAKNEKMSTLFGVESDFLIRIGDSGYPENQVQLVANRSRFPSADASHGLPTKQWLHIAVVWDGTTGERIIYHDGKQVDYKQVSSRGTVDLRGNVSRPCYIGKSYNDLRWLEGDIAELRVWNVQRTAQELIDNRYSVDPESDEVQGKLYAYWKFDEGEGNVVHDRSGNGNDAVAASDVKWIPVALPETDK